MGSLKGRKRQEPSRSQLDMEWWTSSSFHRRVNRTGTAVMQTRSASLEHNAALDIRKRDPWELKARQNHWHHHRACIQYIWDLHYTDAHKLVHISMHIQFMPRTFQYVNAYRILYFEVLSLSLSVDIFWQIYSTTRDDSLRCIMIPPSSKRWNLSWMDSKKRWCDSAMTRGGSGWHSYICMDNFWCVLKSVLVISR